MYLLKVYKYIHTSIQYKILMQSPCNIDWIYPTQNMFGKEEFMMFKIYTTHIHTHIITHHMATYHFSSIAANKILTNIYNKILNFDMQVFHYMTHPPKSFHSIAQRELTGQNGPKNYGQRGHKTNNPWTHSLTSLHTTQMEPRLDIQGISDNSPCHLKCGINVPNN